MVKSLDWLKSYAPIILLLISVLYGSLEFVVKPHAEQFINDQIAARKLATTGSVEGIKGTATQTDKRVKAIRDTQIRTETKLQNLEGLLKEQRDLSNQILLRLPSQ